jgi:RNA polymerase sigma-70 factor, ECF subfamily
MDDHMLLDSAGVFGDQVAHHRGELFAHCYRMMGTVDEAEDALQEALTRAWEGRHTFRRSISFRAWLFRIATNVCLNAIEHRKRDHVEPGPCPNDLLAGIASPDSGPEARFDTHESVSLAFLTVLQVLPPRQRAVLLLRDVLAFRGAEVALLLGTTVQSVNSLLQRARATLQTGYARPAKTPDPSNLLQRYVRAWEAADVAGLVALLREDAVLSMPPKPPVVGGRTIGEFLSAAIFPIAPMRLIDARANDGPAFAAYRQEPSGNRATLFALLVIGSDGHVISRIHAYSDPRVLSRFGLRSWMNIKTLVTRSAGT